MADWIVALVIGLGIVIGGFCVNRTRRSFGREEKTYQRLHERSETLKKEAIEIEHKALKAKAKAEERMINESDENVVRRFLASFSRKSGRGPGGN